MSMQLNFDPHSWYKSAAIEKRMRILRRDDGFIFGFLWHAYIEDGMNTYSVVELHARTLKDLKAKIEKYRFDAVARYSRHENKVSA